MFPCPVLRQTRVDARGRPSFSAVGVFLLIMLASCDSQQEQGAASTATTLPPEAYGTFLESNDPTFRRVLLVEARRVVLTLSVLVRGQDVGAPTQCSSPPLERLVPEMTLTLTCRGEQIPYTLTFRQSSSEWLVVEDGEAPLIFRRN
jgi:hypothetical protein